MNNFYRASVIGSLLILSGCMSVQEERAQLQASATPNDLCYHAAAINGGTKKQAAYQLVQEKGLQCDWAAYAQLHLQQQQQLAATSAALGAMGTQLMIAGQPQPQPVIYNPPPRTTNCRYIGTTLNCTSF